MCGIFGVVSSDPVVTRLLEGLKRLEYRGYDSSGIATISDGDIHHQKAEGKIINLEAAIKSSSIPGNTGIAHTRWATHGKPIKSNAHPHLNDQVAVVHNGIIENFRILREELEAKGYEFVSDTDTETVPYLIDSLLKDGLSVKDAIYAALKKIKGAFALGIILSSNPEQIIAAKRGSPLAIGIGKENMYMGSDAYVMAPLTNKICYLEDDEVAFLTKDKVQIFNSEGQEIIKNVITSSLTSELVGKGRYKHFMLKEINEQPTVIAHILNSYYDRIQNEITFPKVSVDYKNIKRLIFVACGSSHYSAIIAKIWLEKYSNVDCKVEIASEFLYSNSVEDSDLVIFISQSGETADTAKVLQFVKKKKIETLVITNSEHSSMAMDSDNLINIIAGPEIGVASTKAFTAQLTILALFAVKVAYSQEKINGEKQVNLCRALRSIPVKMNEFLHDSNVTKTIARKLADIHNIIYLGRGPSYGLAAEAALKLKEISYIHAEGIAAGELKHGPIALIDKDLFIVAIAPSNLLFDKMFSNLQEVSARGGKIIAISDKKGVEQLKDIAAHVIEIPEIDDYAVPILYSLPIQLLAYYVAVTKGTDVDQPRNLAKSVTVE